MSTEKLIFELETFVVDQIEIDRIVQELVENGQTEDNWIKITNIKAKSLVIIIWIIDRNFTKTNQIRIVEFQKASTKFRKGVITPKTTTIIIEAKEQWLIIKTIIEEWILQKIIRSHERKISKLKNLTLQNHLITQVKEHRTGRWEKQHFLETTKVSSTPKRQNPIRLTTKRLSQKRTGVIVTKIQHPDQPTKKEQRQKQLRPIVEKGEHGQKNNPATLNDEILNEGPHRLTIVIDKKAQGIN